MNKTNKFNYHPAVVELRTRYKHRMELSTKLYHATQRAMERQNRLATDKTGKKTLIVGRDAQHNILNVDIFDTYEEYLNTVTQVKNKCKEHSNKLN